MRFRSLESYKKGKYGLKGFPVDKKFEELTNEWMKENLGYSSIEPEEFVKDCERQLKGIDIVSKSNGNIDEKAIAGKLNTFCFELSGNLRSNKQGVDAGWLFKQDSETDAYLLEYFRLDEELDYKSGKERVLATEGKSIRGCECILIQKNILVRTICNYFDIEKEAFSMILEECRKACEKGTNRFFTIEEGHLKPLMPEEKKSEDMWITVSPSLKECPINIVIRKQLLKRIADKTWVISNRRQNMI